MRSSPAISIFICCLPALGEGEQDEAVVGRDVNQPVVGEILQHAFANAVIRAIDSERERMSRAGGARTFLPSTETTCRNSMRLRESESFSGPTVYSETICTD